MQLQRAKGSERFIRDGFIFKDFLALTWKGVLSLWNRNGLQIFFLQSWFYYEDFFGAYLGYQILRPLILTLVRMNNFVARGGQAMGWIRHPLICSYGLIAIFSINSALNVFSIVNCRNFFSFFLLVFFSWFWWFLQLWRLINFELDENWSCWKKWVHWFMGAGKLKATDYADMEGVNVELV